MEIEKSVHHFQRVTDSLKAAPPPLPLRFRTSALEVYKDIDSQHQVKTQKQAHSWDRQSFYEEQELGRTASQKHYLRIQEDKEGVEKFHGAGSPVAETRSGPGLTPGGAKAASSSVGGI